MESRYSRSSGEKTRKTEEEGGTGRKEGGREETRKRVGKRKRWENGRGELGGGGARKGRMIVQREGGREMAK